MEIWVLDHFTEKSFHRIFLTEKRFDLTPFDWMPLDQIAVKPKAVWLKIHFTE
jgi:hypothetical protein